ncbi:MAG: serine/threonine protein kinase [Planctomycetes bacterium]|nr:serine/threonine protein kinase [Planctomycetota bacterium]
MQIRCSQCGRGVTVAAAGALPERCPHCHGTVVPARLGRWRVERLIAAGGMGEVYLARHLQLGTAVAIKLLPQGAGGPDASVLRERFAREALLTASIEHPGVVRVLDFDDEGGRAYLVMELAAGRSLRAVLGDGPLPVPRAVRVAAAVADVLAAAHRRDVVHRDVKPENVMIGPDDGVRVLDFGIARALADEQPLTRTGEILGTPEYMAPEQLLEGSDAIGPRTDVHGLGLLLYEMLTGVAPFRGSNVFQAMKLVESVTPPPPSSRRAGIPAALDTVVARALAKDPGERFADAADFRAALCKAAPESASLSPATSSGRARVAVRAGIGIAALAGIAVGVVLGGGVGGSRRVGDASPAVQPASAANADDESARVRLLALLDDAGADPGELRAARAALATTGDRAEFALRGRVALRLGALCTADAELQRGAAAGVPGAAEPAAVAWVALHVLLPAAVDAPSWLRLCDRTGRVRVLGAERDEADGTIRVSPTREACRLLAAGDGAAAFAALGGDAFEPADPESAALALLAAKLGCADVARVARYAERHRPARPTVLWRLLEGSLVPAGSPAAEVRDELRSLIDSLDAAAPDRWLLELLLAFLEARDGLRDPSRMLAAAELAWLTGGGELVPVWLAGLRIELARRQGGNGLDAGDASQLERLLHGFDVATHPALAVIRPALAAAQGRAPEGVAGVGDAVIGELGIVAMLAADGEPTPVAVAIARAISGRSRNAVATLQPLVQAGDADARLVMAILTDDPTERAQLWRAALIGGADVGWLAVLRVSPDRAPTVADLAAAERAGATPAALLAGARTSVAAGVAVATLDSAPELEGLRDRIATEVLGGLAD